MLGIQKHEVVLVPHSSKWKEDYRAERSRIKKILGKTAEDIEHVGSTAVQGLKAKPIIDIAVAVRNREAFELCIKPLNDLGYEFLGEYGIPDRYFFRKGENGKIKYHVHVCVLEGDFWVDHLLFRDYLRRHPEILQQYEEIKEHLASKYSKERSTYTEAKSEFILSVVKKAKKEILM